MTTLAKIGRYEVLRELGHGSMGTVYLARDTALGRLVALKTFRPGAPHPDLEDSVNLRRRVLREAQRAGALSHPNVITIFDVVEHEDSAGGFFIVMEYVEGGGLDARLKQSGPLPLPEASHLVSQIAAALDHLHARGIVHRDIKPANVLVTDDGKVKLTDFGVARAEDPTATLETEIYGTPHYMAPEQVQGQPIDGRADVFGLGVLVYEMLTGTRPFPGRTVAEVAHQVVYRPMAEPRLGDRPLPGPVQDLLARALEKDPARRYPTAGALAVALARIAEGRSDLDAADTAALPRYRWMQMLAAGAPPERRARRAALVLAVILPAALLLGGALLYLQQTANLDQPMEITGEREALDAGYRRLMKEGERLLAQGDPQAAAVLFQTAAGLTGDPSAAHRLHREAERRAALAGADLPPTLDGGDQFAAARDLLGPGAGRAEARRVLSEVESTLRPRRAAVEPAEPPPATKPTAAAPQPLPPGTLMVQLHSDAPQGVLRLWVDDTQVLEKSFSFYEGRFPFRRAAVPGEWGAELAIRSGLPVPVRVLVARPGEPATVKMVDAVLAGGERRVLAIRVPAEGSPSVELQ